MDTRTTLLDHAEMLARTRGFEAFSFADLATALDMRKASVHYHFSTKAALALALIRRYRESFMARLALIDAPEADDRLRAYIALYRETLGSGDRLCLCVAFSCSRDSFDAAVGAEIHGFHRDSLNWLADVFALGQIDETLPNADPAGAAYACLALCEGAQIMARAAGEAHVFDRATAQILKG
jgi:TetR/AcrR family transcriptional repressor of nem operon